MGGDAYMPAVLAGIHQWIGGKEHQQTMRHGPSKVHCTNTTMDTIIKLHYYNDTAFTNCIAQAALVS